MHSARFTAAFILLSLFTLLLVGYSVQFFSQTPLASHLFAWLDQGFQRAGTGDMVRMGQSLPTITPINILAAEQDMVQAAQQTATPPAVTPEPPTREVVLPPQPTREPVIEVIEEPPPDGSLVIPALNLDQPVVTVPVSEGFWSLGELGTDVGWLQTTGTRPRDDLAMVFVGHITLPYPGGPGPFFTLHELKRGDVVGYRTGQKTYIYEVRGQTIVEPHQVEQLYRRDGKRLLMVTCTGYNALSMEYDLRVIVEAELVGIEQ